MTLPDFQCVKCGDVCPSPSMGPYDGKCCHCFDSDDDVSGVTLCPVCQEVKYCTQHGLCVDCDEGFSGDDD